MTKLNDCYEYSICEHFLSAMVNGDRSGLDDDEDQALKEFYAALPTDSGVWEFADESSMASCDIIGGYAVCVKAKLHFHNTNIVATPLNAKEQIWK